MADKTLNDVVEHLTQVRDVGENTTSRVEKTNEAVNDLNDVMARTFKMFDRKFSEDALNAEEARREGKTSFSRAAANNNSAPDNAESGNMLGTILRGTFLGTLAARVIKILTPIGVAISANLLKPLLAIGRFFLTKSPWVLALMAAWQVFKDIGDNPAFVEAIEGIRATWNDNVLPTWERLKTAFDGFLHSPIMEASISTISGYWATAVNWFTNVFDPMMEHILVDQINVISDLIGDIAASIDAWLEDGVWAGLTTLVGGLGTAMYNSLDSLITRVGNAFGMEFGDGETWASRLGKDLHIIGAHFAQKFDEIKADTMAGLGNAVGWVSDVFGEIGSFASRMKMRFDNVMDRVDIGMIKVGDFIKSIPDKLLSLIGRMLDFQIPRVAIPFDNWMMGKGEIELFGGGRPFSGAGEMADRADSRINAQVLESNDRISRLEAQINRRSETLAELSAERSVNQAAAANITIVAPTTSSQSQTNNTSISAFPSPFNEFAPQ